MNDKYKILVENPHYCNRLFGVRFELLEMLFEKV